MWLSNWVGTVEPIRSALRATLLIRDKTNQGLHVNMDPKILELIQETKWLLRLNCNVPEGAKDVLKQVQFRKGVVEGGGYDMYTYFVTLENKVSYIV